jgi:predicted metal-dependent hydrolase
MLQQSSGIDPLINSLAFLEAVDAFNNRQWYAAHDRFEDLWYETTGQLREFLQAVIQIAVSEYHFENGNIKGSILLMAEGLNHLASSRSLQTGYDLDSLHSLVSQRLLALQTIGDVGPHTVPCLSQTTRDPSSSPVSIVVATIGRQ